MANWAASTAIVAGPAELARAGVVLARGRPRAKLLLLGNAAAVTEALPMDVALPLYPNSVVRTEGVGACLWLRPDQRLLLLAADAAPHDCRADSDSERVRRLGARCRRTLRRVRRDRTRRRPGAQRGLQLGFARGSVSRGQLRANPL